MKPMTAPLSLFPHIINMAVMGLPSGIIRLEQLYRVFEVLRFRTWSLHVLGKCSAIELFLLVFQETDVRYMTLPYSGKEKLSQRGREVACLRSKVALSDIN